MPADTWTIARHRLRTDLSSLVVLWLFLVAGVAVMITLLFAAFGDLASSVWEQASEFARWFAGAMGIYVTGVYLPLYIAHGRTRREVARQLPIVAVLYTAAFAALLTLGYGIERLVYHLGGWPQALADPHLYDHAGQYHLVFIEFWLLLVVWFVGGMMLGGGFYRSTTLGLSLIVPAVAVIIVVDRVLGPGSVGPFPQELLAWLPLPAPSLVTAVVVCLATTVLLGAGTWRLIRDLPLRTGT